ncbi:MAG: diacylglycerol kinase (ATP) [Phycisphaerales bacterium]|jgi:diacylglycerol kinase (ATP)
MVIYNPVSGRGRSCKSAGAIAELLVRVPCDVELVQTKPTSPTQWLLPKLQYNPNAIVVVGGDGTLRQIASIAKNTNIPVYHAACGTENLFAKSMAVSRTPEVIVEKIKQRSTTTIDTATANDSFMLLMASVGFDAAVVADLSEHRGTSITHFSYIMPIVRQLLRWTVPTVSITVDDKEVVSKQKGWVVVANCKAYARGLNPARNADIADGKLDMVFFPLTGRWSLLKWIRLMKRGTHLHHPEVLCLRGKTVVVRTSMPSAWQIDGDPAGEFDCMHVTCVPKSLEVFAS